jgi:hypothetical protein
MIARTLAVAKDKLPRREGQTPAAAMMLNTGE